MSLDSGTYVLRTKSPQTGDPEFRVAQCFAVDNLFDEEKGFMYIHETFKESPPIPSILDAIDVAYKIDGEETEHGVLFITDHSDLTFADIEEKATPHDPVTQD